MNSSAFVINLPQRPDRRREMEAELKRVNWHAEFFPAIRPTDAGDFPSIGARGCFLSHLAVLKEAARRQSDRAIILEDDLNFSRKFEWQKVQSFMESNDWDIVYPSHFLDDLSDGISPVPSDRGVMSAHFVLINGRAIPRLIDGLEVILGRPAGHPRGGPMHVDGAYSAIRHQNPDIKTFAAFPVLGYQRSSKSDIAEIRFFDRIGMLRGPLNALRRLKTSLKDR